MPSVDSRTRAAVSDVHAFLNATAQWDGRYINRLSESARDAIRAAADAYLRADNTPRDWPEWPYPSLCLGGISGKARVFTLAKIREHLDNLSAEIEIIEWAETHKALSTWLTARETLNRTQAEMHALAREKASQTKNPRYLNWHLYF